MRALQKSRQSIFYSPEVSGQGLSVFKIAVVWDKLSLGYWDGSWKKLPWVLQCAVAGMVVLGWRLDLMIWEVFSSLSDSMILSINQWVPEVYHFHSSGDKNIVEARQKKAAS